MNFYFIITIYSEEKGKLFGYYEYQVFYDMNSKKITKTIKVGNGENSASEIFLINILIYEFVFLNILMISRIYQKFKER